MISISTLCTESDLPVLETELLLAHVLDQNRTWILAHPEYPLTEEQHAMTSALIERRRAHEPIAYITGNKEFYGREFTVSPAVLIPRPSTEYLVNAGLHMLEGGNNNVELADTEICIYSQWLQDDPPSGAIHTVVDVGTGSGAIAITMALERPDISIVATDTSNNALEVATNNAELHGVQDRITFCCESRFESVVSVDEPFLLLSNPPYIPEEEELMTDVCAFEPGTALFAGTDGMSVVRPLLQCATNNPHCIGVVLECRDDQKAEVEKLL